MPRDSGSYLKVARHDMHKFGVLSIAKSRCLVSRGRPHQLLARLLRRCTAAQICQLDIKFYRTLRHPGVSSRGSLATPWSVVVCNLIRFLQTGLALLHVSPCFYGRYQILAVVAALWDREVWLGTFPTVYQYLLNLYEVPAAQCVVWSNGRWRWSGSLP